MKIDIKRSCGIVKSKYFSSEPFCEKENQATKLVKWFVVLALIGGILIILFSPPFTCPDENCHYINICRIVEGSFFPVVKDNNIGSYVTVDQNNFLSSFYGKYDGIGAEKFTFWDAYFQGFLEFNNDEKIFYSTRLSAINPVAYIIPATGAFIAKNIFCLSSPYTMLMFAKLFNLLFYIAVTALAIKKTPILKRTMLLISLMPMTLYQCASASYDALIIPCSMLLLAYIAKMLLSETDYVVSLEDIVCVCLACIGVFSAKIAYAPLVLILLTIPIKKFGTLKKYFVCIGAVASVALLFYAVPTLVCNSIGKGCENTTWEIIDLQKEYFFSNIGIIFPVLKNTIYDSRIFWTTGFFGVLGNLDTQFPPMFIVLYYLLLVFTAIVELSVVKGVPVLARILSAFACIVFFVGTVIAMYTTWTPFVTGVVGGNTSTGFQGRYFIPIALFIIFVFSNPALKRYKYIDGLVSAIDITTKYGTLIYVILTSVIMLLRFWV